MARIIIIIMLINTINTYAGISSEIFDEKTVSTQVGEKGVGQKLALNPPCSLITKYPGTYLQNSDTLRITIPKSWTRCSNSFFERGTILIIRLIRTY